MLDDEEALAGARGPGIKARLRAARVLAVQRVLARTNWQRIADGRTARDVHPEAVARVLARTNWQRIADGRTARDVHPEAVADADQAFAQLR